MRIILDREMVARRKTYSIEVEYYTQAASTNMTALAHLTVDGNRRTSGGVAYPRGAGAPAVVRHRKHPGKSLGGGKSMRSGDHAAQWATVHVVKELVLLHAMQRKQPPRFARCAAPGTLDIRAKKKSQGNRLLEQGPRPAGDCNHRGEERCERPQSG